jgi:hypothetical protein
LILVSGRVYFPHDAPPSQSVKPFVSDVVPIRKGDPYTGPLGHAATADSDGALIVALGQIVCAERLGSMLGQMDYKVRKRSC